MTDRKAAQPDLWCVRVIGPDDTYPCRSHGHAVLMAEDINAKLRQWAEAHPGVASDPNTPSMSAVVEVWPWSAEAHARGLVA